MPLRGSSMALTKRPKLGQHFLHDVNYRLRIITELSILKDEVVIEIGPGRGAMTRLLAKHARTLVAIEVDPVLADRLRQEFAPDPRVSILNGDVLKVDFAETCRQQGSGCCFVFGNLPYYITSPILHHLFAQRECIRAMGLLVQSEVAERMVAHAGSRDNGYLTICTQLYSRPRIALAVPPGAFSPPPRVHSALVELQMAPRFPTWGRDTCDEFLEFVKRCFAQKRKNLVNNLGGLYTRERVARALGAAGKPGNVRAEELSLDALAAVFKSLTGEDEKCRG
jgi:16S rRNA (adenine1518-N6/adenine1519-N6)-dimethyltransferase